MRPQVEVERGCHARRAEGSHSTMVCGTYPPHKRVPLKKLFPLGTNCRNTFPPVRLLFWLLFFILEADILTTYSYVVKQVDLRCMVFRFDKDSLIKYAIFMTLCRS